MKPVVLTLTLILIAARLQGSAQRPSAGAGEMATEAQVRAAVQNVEQLAQGLQAGLRKYHDHLKTAMQRKGYGQ